MNELSERLKKAVDFLKRSGYVKSYADVARRVGVTSSTITMVLNGTRVPTWELILDFCDAYPVNIRWIRKGDGMMIREDREMALLKRIEELEKMIAEMKE